MTITKEEIRKEVKKHLKKGNSFAGSLVFKEKDGRKTYYTTSAADVVEDTVNFICKCLNLKEGV